MARLYVATDAAAEEVVQETWLGALKGLDGFEGRSSLKTWLYRILINVAETRGVRDQRSVPFSSAFDARAERDEGVVDSERFLPEEHDRWPRALGRGSHALARRGLADRRVDRADPHHGGRPARPSA